jgi:hypothetical protein
MIRLLEGNPVGIVLAAVSGAFVFAALILGLLWALPPIATTDEPGAEESALKQDVPELPETEPMERFAVITERPVFNPTRQPQLTEGGEEELEDELEEEVDAPDLTLAGVVITPSIRMVTLKQPDEKVSLVAFEGQPLEGDFGSWHVSRVEPRQITLSSGTGQERQLALEVHKEKIAEPPEPKPAKGGDEKSAAASSDTGEDRPMTRAEEIRQRIAERREELRRAAEAEEAGESAEQQEARPVNYRSAINAMIGAKKKETSDEENEQ